MTTNDSPVSQRIASLDQFRGYTVLGMFVVNFLGGFLAAPWILKHHHTFCSYADTIMPQFFLAVGLAMRWTMARRVETLGERAAHGRMVRRVAGLLLIAAVIYTADRPAQHWSELVERGWWDALRGPLKRDLFQTLTHIAVTTLWILLVIRESAGIRVTFMIGSAAAHVAISEWGYFAWVNNGSPNGIDGGPLGFLTWTIPMIVGSLCADSYLEGGRPSLGRWFGWACVLMACGYVLSCGTRFYDVIPQEDAGLPKLAASPVVPPREAVDRAWSEFRSGEWGRLFCEPPFCPPPHPTGDLAASYRLRQWNYWMMSQRSGTVSYLLFATGLALALLGVAHLLCDRLDATSAILRTLGTNALAGYLLHSLVAEAVQRFMPKDVPGWYLACGCGLYLLITYVLLRGLERSGIYLRM